MIYPINTSSLTESLDFYTEVISMQARADQYIKGFPWCAAVKTSSLYFNLGEKLCVFLYEIDNSASKEDNFLWVIVGDLPSMYLDTYGPKTTMHVLADYADLAKDWITKVESGLSVAGCYPFNAEPTVEIAEMLKKRVVLIENSVIPNMDEIELPALLKER
ncbi:hypothetical protein [Pedobacter lusitanus]|nr:hypothetical protein [Pedobacter lusitanus]